MTTKNDNKQKTPCTCTECPLIKDEACMKSDGICPYHNLPDLRKAYDDGYSLGYSEGTKLGYHKGYGKGYNEGYDAGYDDRWCN